MITKLIIPVIDTESGKFSYNGNLTKEEYDNMVMDKFLSTNNKMNKFVDNMMNGISNVRSNGYYTANHQKDFPDIKYNFFETDVFVQDSKKNDIDASFFQNYIENEKMFILILNINPNMEPDAESELRFWMDDSLKVTNDTTLDTQTRLKVLPKRGFKILINNVEYVLEGCKILQNYSNKKYPFYFAVIVEKITR